MLVTAVNAAAGPSCIGWQSSYAYSEVNEANPSAGTVPPLVRPKQLFQKGPWVTENRSAVEYLILLHEDIMTFFVVDVEADGPIPGDYSMVSFGAVIVEEGLQRTFYAQLKPISEKWIPEALNVSGLSREQCLEEGEDPTEVMTRFEAWIQENSKGRPIFISDNNSFDWMFVCWYFHHFIGRNPFGYSSRRISDLYCGLKKNAFAQWKHLRTTPHTHHPVDDAKGNAEVILHMRNEMGLNIKLK